MKSGSALKLGVHISCHWKPCHFLHLHMITISLSSLLPYNFHPDTQHLQMQCSEAGMLLQIFLLIKQSYQLVHCNSILQVGLLKTGSATCSATAVQVSSLNKAHCHCSLWIQESCQQPEFVAHLFHHFQFFTLVEELLGQSRSYGCYTKQSQGVFPVMSGISCVSSSNSHTLWEFTSIWRTLLS